jgi:hypothetical protein
VFELAATLPTNEWTLVGGLMVQVHALAHGIAVVRPTEDLDVLLNIEISAAVVSRADRALAQLGYSLQEPADARRRTSPHYRYTRPSAVGVETIDLMAPDHAPPAAARRLRGRPMFEVEGGTQALRRIMAYSVETTDGDVVTLAVPDELGALVMKGAAYSVDRRDRDRHLRDAAVLAACITDHAVELARLGGSDRRRLRTLASALADPTHPAWLVLGPELRVAGEDTLRILTG